jgi:diguanylate cyclase (GGDEF)-like protein/PAS domain S-box-containing protein
MSNTLGPETYGDTVTPPAAAILPASASAEQWMTELHALLHELEAVTAASHTLPPVFSEPLDNQLVQVRLGTAASLFAALQCKNAATAGHALRVTLTCSAWAVSMGLPPEQRDAIEIAALLHDIGVIGAPDNILLKPGALDSDEAAVMTRSRKMSLGILRHSCRAPQVLEIVEKVAAWYDGSRNGFSCQGEEIPLGARMIAIVEAFDAMITDHVYRPARSQERAMAELFECAGTQFDPELVGQFAQFRKNDPESVRWEVAHRWLRSLDPETIDSFWEMSCLPSPQTEPPIDAVFQTKLLEHMYDAVMFIDAAGQVTLWNRGAERLTGVAGTSVHGRLWQPELLSMSDEKGRPVTEADCPVCTAIRCGVQSLRRLTIFGRNGRPVVVDTHAIPVMNETGVAQGAILLFHDASSETSLEQRCQSLHEKATKDQMTQVANRAEFDRVHAMFVAAHQQQQVPCSLLICDMDRFKLVNDTYGHQAGDDAIKSLAALLKNCCRPGDLVARYGGEEFVILCADCDNAAAARRAEQIRKALSQIAQPRMDGRAVTVSFGVTEIQPGDTPETMLRRADRALLMAKANGRNTVVQLGSGSEAEEGEVKSGGWFFSSARPKDLLTQDLVTPVPVKMAIEKLRGFVADHQAKIITIDANEMELEIDDKRLSPLRRLTDRAVAFCIRLRFEEERLPKNNGAIPQVGSGVLRTKIKITIAPRKNRDRRRSDVMDRAREVLVSFRSYLIASEEESVSSKGVLTRAKRMLALWLGKK